MLFLIAHRKDHISAVAETADVSAAFESDFFAEKGLHDVELQ